MSKYTTKEATAKIIVTGKGDAKLESNLLDLHILKYLNSKGKSYCNHIGSGVEGVMEVETSRTVGGRLKALETLGFVSKETNTKNNWIYWSITPTGSGVLAIFEKKAGVVVDEATMDAAEAAEFAKKTGKKGTKKATTVDLSAFGEDEEEAASEEEGEEEVATAGSSEEEEDAGN